jgi:hypothetical protein
MNSRLLLISALVAAAAAMGGASDRARSEPNDAQSQAAALLTGQRARGAVRASDHGHPSTSSSHADAQASAVALLTGLRSTERPNAFARIYPPKTQRTQEDAHAKAAALLSGSRTRAGDVKRDASAATASDE